MMLQQSRKF